MLKGWKLTSLLSLFIVLFPQCCFANSRMCFNQVQSIEGKLDLLLNFYSQCLKKGSSNFTLSTLLDPELTSDYQSPTDQRDLFPSANTLNISLSESGNLE